MHLACHGNQGSNADSSYPTILFLANHAIYHLMFETTTTAIAAFNQLKSKRSTLTVSYYVKNYLLLMNSIHASLGPGKQRFKRSGDLNACFALGYYEDLYSGKIHYLAGTQGSPYITAIELEKDDNRYNLSDIVVHSENARKIRATLFLDWLKKTTLELTLDLSEDSTGQSL